MTGNLPPVPLTTVLFGFCLVKVKEPAIERAENVNIQELILVKRGEICETAGHCKNCSLAFVAMSSE